MREGLCVIIMAGGAGTRFWPASTEEKPKQLLTLVGDRSMLQQSFDRARALAPVARILVVTNQALVGPIRAQLPELPADHVVGEPERKDTAAAVALAALWASAHGATQAVVLTADHVIAPTAAFVDAVDVALGALGGAGSSDAIVTFGIVPTFAATGYGYIEVDDASGGAVRARRFVEKPDRATAAGYLASGRFLWNSGMFTFAVAPLLAALSTHLPAHVAALKPVVDAGLVDDAAFRAAFASLPRQSFDKGVMEKHHNVWCVPARFQWSDVGSFPALADHLDNDAAHNAHRGALRTLDAHGNVVWCEDDSEEVALVGVSDLVVVRVGKKTLVVPKARAEDVKKLLGG
jgi:mannose-1-phosphate guanylyltransferase